MKEQAEIIALFRADGEIPDPLYDAIIQHLTITYGEGHYGDVEICAIKRTIPVEDKPKSIEYPVSEEDDDEEDEYEDEINDNPPVEDNTQLIGLKDTMPITSEDIISTEKLV